MRQAPPQADAVCRFLENRELTLAIGRARRPRLVEQFSLEPMVWETEQRYLKLIRKASDRGE